MKSILQTSTTTSSEASREESAQELLRLKAITDQLRNPDGGCEWDLKQSFASMKEDLLEEVYELIYAVEKKDFENIAEEIGDVLFLLFFYIRLGEEEGLYDLSSVARNVADKLVRRHPHVFGDTQVRGVDDILDNWETIKRKEKAAAGTEDTQERAHLFAPRAYGFLPALKRAEKISTKAARKGFDWPSVEGALSKLEEEIGELRSEILQDSASSERLSHELGDVLFSLVNVARKLGLSAEFSLHSCTERFIERFSYMEDALGDDFDKSELETLDRYWNKAKDFLEDSR